MLLNIKILFCCCFFYQYQRNHCIYIYQSRPKQSILTIKLYNFAERKLFQISQIYQQLPLNVGHHFISAKITDEKILGKLYFFCRSYIKRGYPRKLFWATLVSYLIPSSLNYVFRFSPFLFPLLFLFPLTLPFSRSTSLLPTPPPFGVICF